MHTYQRHESIEWNARGQLYELCACLTYCVEGHLYSCKCADSGVKSSLHKGQEERNDPRTSAFACLQLSPLVHRPKYIQRACILG